MKNIKELFQNFETNHMVYFAPDALPAMDLAEANLVATVTPRPRLGDKAIPTKEFENKKQVAMGVLKNIHLDSDLSQQNKAEKDLAGLLENYIDDQFMTLEHNYQEELKLVGRGPENQEAIEAKKALNKAADNFIFKMEMYVIQLSIESGDKQGELMAQIRLIDGFTKVPGFGQHFIDGNPNLVKSLIQSNPRNREEFNKLLSEMFDNEKNLERGVVAMIKKTPNFKEMNNEGKVDEGADTVQNEKEKRVFELLIGKSIRDAENSGKPDESLTYYMGVRKWPLLQQTFARRFCVRFQEQGNGKSELSGVDHYVDLMNNNKIIQPDEIDAYLLRLSRASSLRSPEQIEEYNEEIDEKEEAQADLYNELLRGFTWSSDDEVTGLDTLRNNSQLNRLIQTTARYENVANEATAEINEQLANFNRDIGKSSEAAVVKGITNKLTPDFIKRTPALRGAGALVALLELIRQLSGNTKEEAIKNTTSLSEVSRGLDRGENPSAEVKKSQERYKKNLPKASVTDIFNAYANPKGTEAENLFKKANETPPKKDEYPTIAVPKAIESHLKEVLDFDKLINIKKTGNKFNLNFKINSEIKMLTLEIKGDDLVITDLDKKDASQTIKKGSTSKELAKALNEQAKVKVATEALPTNRTYIDGNGVLKGITETTKIHDILNPKEFDEITITLETIKRSDKQVFKTDEKEIKLIPGKEGNDDTYVIAPDQSNAGERLLVFNGDQIKSVKRKPAPSGPDQVK